MTRVGEPCYADYISQEVDTWKLKRGDEMSTITKAVKMAKKAELQAELEEGKATGATVKKVKELVELRAQIAELEKKKVELTTEIEAVFGVDKDNKTSKHTTLTYHGVDVVRYEWRKRKGVDEKKLAEEFPEAYEACMKADKTIYGLVVSLFK